MKTNSKEVYDFIHQIIEDSKLHPAEYGGSPEGLEEMWHWLDHCSLFMLGKNRQTKEHPLGFSMSGFIIETRESKAMNFTYYIKREEKITKEENIYKRLIRWRKKYENWFLKKMKGNFELKKNKKQVSTEINKLIKHSKERPLMYGGTPEGVLNMWGWLDKVSIFIRGGNYDLLSMEVFCQAHYKLGIIGLIAFLRQDEINSHVLSIEDRKVFLAAQSKRLRDFRNRYEKWLKNQESTPRIATGVS